MAKLQKTGALNQKIKNFADAVGNLLVDGFHYLALFAIGGSIVWSAVFAFIAMAVKSHAAIEDILLLFIYLELGAMVGIYFKTNHMPVRFLIYVAVTALTRMLLGKIQANHEPDYGILLISGAILLLAIATLVFRYGSTKFPSVKASDDGTP
ncbi:MAG TPA: phosphate-starvation-inducible PsiE family protein [Acidiferrobacterales bacterium]|nr:phosphate-starvation-inducible PsiE family protein [Acidiferrobacterales bacterium]